MTIYSSEWKLSSKLPDNVGFAGMYAGNHKGTLICAGGANFPVKPMLEGGPKTWTDRVFVQPKGTKEWIVANMPMALAYGSSVSLPQGVLCIGGCDQTGHKNDVFLLSWHHDTLETVVYPSLPKALAYSVATVCENKVYVMSGCEAPGEQDCTNEMWSLDLDNVSMGWVPAPALPGRGRFLCQVATYEENIYVLGGIGLIKGDDKYQRELLTEAWSYTPSEGWKQLESMPYAIAAAPTPAPVSPGGNIYLLGGDEGSGKLYTPQTNPGFKNQSLCYNSQNDTWHDGGQIDAPRAVLPTCERDGLYYLFNGEIKPGLRSNEVWSVNVL